MRITKKEFGVTSKQEKVTKYILTNENGMEVTLIDLGAVITGILVPDKNGNKEDVVLGFDTVKDYETNPPSLGAVVGRFANRIANAKFTLNGKEYTLDQNDGKHCLHSGYKRLEHGMYQAECSEGLEECSVSFTRVSPSMEQGFPGNLTLSITYTLNDQDELMIEYYAVTDEDTIINLTNHSYFNIGIKGHKTPSICSQEMQLMADSYTPVNDERIPTGEIVSVENTPMDFKTMRRIGEDIDAGKVEGYDNNFVLNTQDGTIAKAAVYQDRESGRVMEVFTDFPGIQVYTSNGLCVDDGKEGASYRTFSGICFETQNYPDAVNHDNFPSAVLKPMEEYQRTTVFRFSLMED